MKCLWVEDKRVHAFGCLGFRVADPLIFAVLRTSGSTLLGFRVADLRRIQLCAEDTLSFVDAII